MGKECKKCSFWVKREKRCVILNANPGSKKYEPRGRHLNHHSVKTKNTSA